MVLWYYLQLTCVRKIDDLTSEILANTVCDHAIDCVYMSCHYFSSYLRKKYGLILNQDEKLVYFLYVVCRYFLVIYSWSTHPCLDILLLLTRSYSHSLNAHKWCNGYRAWLSWCRLFETWSGQSKTMTSIFVASLNEVSIKEIFVNLTCVSKTPVYSEHKSWSQGGSV